VPDEVSILKLLQLALLALLALADRQAGGLLFLSSAILRIPCATG